MADIYPKEKRSRIMSLIRSRGNKATELVVVSLLREHRIGGWRRHLPLPGSPDFAFTKQRVAVFVDGCFWHGCPLHFKMPASNQAFWSERVSTNMQRDRRTTRRLRENGWYVIRVWQHDLKKSVRFVSRLQRALKLRAASTDSPPTRR